MLIDQSLLYNKTWDPGCEPSSIPFTFFIIYPWRKSVSSCSCFFIFYSPSFVLMVANSNSSSSSFMQQPLCHDSESSALIQFKLSFFIDEHASIDPSAYPKVVTWKTLASNNIHGPIPRWIWNISRESLLAIDLSGNFLTGFDQHPVVLPWSRLLCLGLGSIMLQGPLPIPPLSTFEYSVSGNKLRGEILALICDMTSFERLDSSMFGQLQQISAYTGPREQQL